MTNRFKRTIRVIAWALVLSFSIEQIGHAAPMSSPATPQVQVLPKEMFNIRDILKDPTKLEVPFEYATLKEIHKGHNGKLIIHIQDAHANLSGQKNIANTLDYYLSKHDIPLVLTEGASRDITLEDIRKMESRKTWKIVAERFLYDGMIAGEEYLNLTKEHPMKLIGIEDQALYDQNVKAYANLKDKRQPILNYLHKIRISLDRIKQKNYPQELLTYEAKGGKEDQFGENYNSLLNLAKQSHIDLSSFQELQKLNSLKKQEQQISFDRVNHEQQKLFSYLSNKGFKKEIENYQSQYKKLSNPISQYKLLSGVIQNLPQADEALSQRYPELTKYKDYLKAFNNLDLGKLLDELDILEEKIYDTLLKDTDKKTIHAIDRFIDLLSKAYKIQMTSREFEMYLTNEPEFKTASWQAFLNKELSELKYYEDLIPYKEILEEAKEALKDFYEIVNQRDLIFLQNIKKAMQDQDVAFLIAGGYHTQHLTKLLKEEGSSYIVLSPIVTQETNHKKYEELLLSQLSKDKPVYAKHPKQSIQNALSLLKGFGLVDATYLKQVGRLSESTRDALVKHSQHYQLAAARLAKDQAPHEWEQSPVEKEIYDFWQALVLGDEDMQRRIVSDLEEREFLVYKEELTFNERILASMQVGPIRDGVEKYIVRLFTSTLSQQLRRKVGWGYEDEFLLNFAIENILQHVIAPRDGKGWLLAIQDPSKGGAKSLWVYALDSGAGMPITKVIKKGYLAKTTVQGHAIREYMMEFGGDWIYVSGQELWDHNDEQLKHPPFGAPSRGTLFAIRANKNHKKMLAQINAQRAKQRKQEREQKAKQRKQDSEQIAKQQKQREDEAAQFKSGDTVIYVDRPWVEGRVVGVEGEEVTVNFQGERERYHANQLIKKTSGAWLAKQQKTPTLSDKVNALDAATLHSTIREGYASGRIQRVSQYEEWKNMSNSKKLLAAGAGVLRKIDGEWHLLLGERSGSVRDFPGEFSLPVGKVDTPISDQYDDPVEIRELMRLGIMSEADIDLSGQRESIIGAAIRELGEETEIHVTMKQIAGRLNDFRGSHEYVLMNVVIIVDPSTSTYVDTNEEFAQTKWIPLRLVLDYPAAQSRQEIEKWLQKEDPQNRLMSGLAGLHHMQHLFHQALTEPGDELIQIFKTEGLLSQNELTNQLREATQELLHPTPNNLATIEDIEQVILPDYFSGPYHNEDVQNIPERDIMPKYAKGLFKREMAKAQAAGLFKGSPYNAMERFQTLLNAYIQFEDRPNHHFMNELTNIENVKIALRLAYFVLFGDINFDQDSIMKDNATKANALARQAIKGSVFVQMLNELQEAQTPEKKADYLRQAIQIALYAAAPKLWFSDPKVQKHPNEARQNLHRLMDEALDQDLALDSVNEFVKEVLLADKPMHVSYIVDDNGDLIYHLYFMQTFLGMNPNLRISLIPKNGRYAIDSTYEDVINELQQPDLNLSNFKHSPNKVVLQFCVKVLNMRALTYARDLQSLFPSCIKQILSSAWGKLRWRISME